MSAVCVDELALDFESLLTLIRRIQILPAKHAKSAKKFFSVFRVFSWQRKSICLGKIDLR